MYIERERERNEGSRNHKPTGDHKICISVLTIGPNYRKI